ncbi:hypothetical protein BpOF4_03640 [Alkalihalophilus pseudofirmus OF4]|uniref:Putative restriction endonuclease domain-containing protein n=1 Tax=Alkalihalophilus pseudofirmus (strain ATCC BAA-2126 / JCM 17055 / OF4) TaxID=398511 RepID=D3FX39_ALKPO|nr:Uma2 family endonuclease [Alkalihalophilus pseudofirmus]ADC48794.1 hypothetical protein BpOF4_03640 [Alkalihalophilus pseudofirmus OF4]
MKIVDPLITIEEGKMGAMSRYSLEEFYQNSESSPNPLEYIHEQIFSLPTSQKEHQLILERLRKKLLILGGMSYSFCSYPNDLLLIKQDDIAIIKPDLAVFKFLNERRQVPDVIFEIISPTNQAHDLVLKLDLYMSFKVSEYWVINPLLKAVLLFSLDEHGYNQSDIAKNEGVVQSKLIPEFKVDLAILFKEQ